MKEPSAAFKGAFCSSLCRRQSFLSDPRSHLLCLLRFTVPVIINVLCRTIILAPPLSVYQENYVPKTMETFIFGNYEQLSMEKEESSYQCTTQPNSSMSRVSSFMLLRAPPHSAQLVLKNQRTRTCAGPTYSGNRKK